MDYLFDSFVRKQFLSAEMTRIVEILIHLRAKFDDVLQTFLSF